MPLYHNFPTGSAYEDSFRFMNAPAADGASSSTTPVVVRILGASGADMILSPSAEDGDAAAAVPFHRVINNTIFGGETPTGTGEYDVSDGAGWFVLPEPEDEVIVPFDTGPELF